MTEGNLPRRAQKVDLAEIKRLAELMEAKDLVEVEIEQEGKRVHVVRGGGRMHTAHAAAPPAYHPAAAAPAAASGAPPAPAASPSRGVEIPSPMVGTFYRAPGPDAAPFVEVGDRISKNTVVCIVEAMKVMNEIKAEVDGEILEVLVQNGEPVEFGQPLFLVKGAGGPSAGAA